jgi:hypothetical protein
VVIVGIEGEKYAMGHEFLDSSDCHRDDLRAVYIDEEWNVDDRSIASRVVHAFGKVGFNHVVTNHRHKRFNLQNSNNTCLYSSINYDFLSKLPVDCYGAYVEF